jgi:hypothetical protein
LLKIHSSNHVRFLRHLAVCFTVAVVPLAESAFAADYPNRAVTIVVPFPAGAGVDLTARLLAEQLAIKLPGPLSLKIDLEPAVWSALRPSRARLPTVTRC